MWLWRRIDGKLFRGVRLRLLPSRESRRLARLGPEPPRSLRSFKFLESGARGVNLLHMLFGMLGEYTEQIQQRDGPALAMLTGAREGFFRQIS